MKHDVTQKVRRFIYRCRNKAHGKQGRIVGHVWAKEYTVETEWWTEKRHDHAARYSYDTPKTRRYVIVDGRRREHAPMEVCTCGRDVYPETVNGTMNPDVKCSARCQDATGPSCECSCGGENHGAGHVAA